jgi:hypothetical protein
MVDEMKYFRVVNWEKYQHYKDRAPKWIKVYSDIFSDFNFLQLTDSERFHLIGLWILASKLNNKIPVDQAYIKAQIFSTSKVNLEKLETLGFIEVVEGDTILHQNASLEEEKRREREEERKRRDRWSKRFDSFWKAYPKKKGKDPAKKAWMKHALNGAEFDTIMAAVKAQSKSEDWTKEGGKYIPHPTTWLNQKRWEDEIQTTQSSTGAPTLEKLGFK